MGKAGHYRYKLVLTHGMKNDKVVEGEVVLAIRSGRAIHFNERTVRPMGRNATGVKGITRGSDSDEVVGMICVQSNESDVLVVSENGYGKRSSLEDYRITNRGGKGVKTINITEKTGQLIAIKDVKDTDDLMIINRSGIAIRLAVSDLRVMGRATQGVKLINLRGEDVIAAVTKIAQDESVEEDELDEEVEGTGEIGMDDDNNGTEFESEK